MVSFWPFKGDDNSAASFEKILSQLSTKINKVSAQNDRFRQRQRRYKVLWTLYSTFAYILIAAILTLVTGWEKWGAVEYSAMGGGPILIYSLRTVLDAYYNYRIANTQTHLNDLSKQREAAIERLKQATKYNSTQQLLEKYGGSPPSKQQPSPQPKGKRRSDMSNNASRTGFAPPPTANIPSRQSLPAQQPARGVPVPGPPPSGLPPPAAPVTPRIQNVPGEEFAPNAFTASQAPPRGPPPVRQAAQYATEAPKWYDRILDVVLGDDETKSENRIVLICAKCRLVNGQAPPGARTLEDIGKWRCSSCGTMNGQESEENKILQHIATGGDGTTRLNTSADPGTSSPTHADEIGETESENDSEGSRENTSPAASTRSKARRSGKA
ncbi:uncharacterized protein RCC_01820 [Ramularia collo-cygni]|uniref:Endoplasmic reticulum junction formation protein lunapark n=1 Tax=Ramularia collo-cygni TaxID=112498 RepID=A0A2D3UT77_9PEZI|nr:uncharacterized protein RCC_01820 [Ramularia collo-cygni]CZT15980.1 uncharacterized protein RCC_01820 [Ramularia collo-cygni]